MISDELKEAISYDPTKQSQTRSISQLNEEIERGKISLPIYQRDLSWTLQKAVDLFNYQLYGKAPVAPLSLNKISLDDDFSVTQVEAITRNIIKTGDIKEGQLSIIDGQQRLTTNYKAYIDDSSFSNIVLDIKKGSFRIIKNNSTNYQIPVGKLLHKSQEVMTNYATQEMKIKDFSVITILIAARSKIMQYSYTIHIANGMNETEQIEWFEVLNNAGSKVSALQMTFAKLGSKQNFDIYAQYGEPFKKLIDDFDLHDLFSPYTTNVSYPIALLNSELELLTTDYTGHKNNYAPIPSDTKEKLLINLNITDLEDVTKNSLSSLEKTLNFFEGYGLTDVITRMDYILYVSGYISFRGLNNEQIPNLVTWVENVNFSNLDNTKRRNLFTELLSL